MRINRLKLHNFLSHQLVDMEFSPGINVVYGKNAVGKSNLVDSIYLSAVGRSYRYNRDKDLINWQASKEAADIELEIQNRFTCNKVKIRINPDGKKHISINGLPIKRMGELMGAVNVVMFHPDELRLVKEGPGDRRRFMDISISQQSKKYFYALLKYGKVLEQRNNILKQYKDMPMGKSLLEITLNDLVYSAEIIMRARKKFVEELRIYAIEEHNKITDNSEKLELLYEGEKVDYDNFKESYIKLLEDSQSNDMRLGYTSVGPHRDDIKISANSIDIRKFGSQGQQRTAVLSLKLAEIRLCERAIGETPVLLLDDVLSELDPVRCNKFCQAINNIQTIVASTYIPNNLQGGTIFHIGEDGVLVRES